MTRHQGSKRARTLKIASAIGAGALVLGMVTVGAAVAADSGTDVRKSVTAPGGKKSREARPVLDGRVARSRARPVRSSTARCARSPARPVRSSTPVARSRARPVRSSTPVARSRARPVRSSTPVARSPARLLPGADLGTELVPRPPRRHVGASARPGARSLRGRVTNPTRAGWHPGSPGSSHWSRHG